MAVLVWLLFALGCIWLAITHPAIYAVMCVASAAITVPLVVRWWRRARVPLHVLRGEPDPYPRRER